MYNAYGIINRELKKPESIKKFTFFFFLLANTLFKNWAFAVNDKRRLATKCFLNSTCRRRLSRRNRSNNTTFAPYARADSSGVVCGALILVAIVPSFAAPLSLPAVVPSPHHAADTPPCPPPTVVNLPRPSCASACIKHPVRVFGCSRLPCTSVAGPRSRTHAKSVRNRRKPKQIDGPGARPRRERGANVKRGYWIERNVRSKNFLATIFNISTFFSFCIYVQCVVPFVFVSWSIQCPEILCLQCL